jgi:hypothetical protein
MKSYKNLSQKVGDLIEKSSVDLGQPSDTSSDNVNPKLGEQAELI